MDFSYRSGRCQQMQIVPSNKIEFDDSEDMPIESYLFTFGRQLTEGNCKDTSCKENKTSCYNHHNDETPKNSQLIADDKTPSSLMSYTKSPNLFSPTQKITYTHTAGSSRRLIHSSYNRPDDSFNDILVSLTDSPIPIWNANNSGESPLTARQMSSGLHLSSSTPVALTNSGSPILSTVPLHVRTSSLSDSSEDEIYNARRCQPQSRLATFIQTVNDKPKSDLSNCSIATPKIQNTIQTHPIISIEDDNYYIWTDSLATPPPSSSKGLSKNHRSFQNAEGQTAFTGSNCKDITMNSSNNASRINSQSKVVARVLFDTAFQTNLGNTNVINSHTDNNGAEDLAKLLPNATESSGFGSMYNPVLEKKRKKQSTPETMVQSKYQILTENSKIYYDKRNCLSEATKNLVVINTDITSTPEDISYSLLNTEFENAEKNGYRIDLQNNDNNKSASADVVCTQTCPSPDDLSRFKKNLDVVHHPKNHLDAQFICTERNEVSDEVLLEAESKEMEAAETVANGSQHLNCLNTPIENICSFRTATGKKVRISDKHLNEAKAMMMEIELEANNFIEGLRKESDLELDTTEEKVSPLKRGSPSLIDSDFTSITKGQGLMLANQNKSNTLLIREDFSSSEQKSFHRTNSYTSNLKPGNKSQRLRPDSHSSCHNTAASFIKDSKSSDGLSGFSTASGQKVPISKAALHRATILLKDIDNLSDGSLEDLKSPHTRKRVSQFVPPRSVQSKTKSLNNSEKSNTGVRMQSIKKTSNTNKVHSNSKNNASEIACNSVAFATASSKEVCVSTESLKQVNALLNDFESHQLLDRESERIKTQNDVGNQNRQDFSNNFVEGSDFVKEKKCVLMQDRDISIKVSGKRESQEHHESNKLHIMRNSDFQRGNTEDNSSAYQQTDTRTNKRSKVDFDFQTARGGCITISDEALQSAKLLLSEVGFENFAIDEMQPELKSEEVASNSNNSFSNIDKNFIYRYATSKGFKKVGEPEIHRNRTESAIRSSDTQLRNCDILDKIGLSESPSGQHNLKSSTKNDKLDISGNVNSGFQTAKGTNITVSDASLDLAESLLSEIHRDSSTINEPLLELAIKSEKILDPDDTICHIGETFDSKSNSVKNSNIETLCRSDAFQSRNKTPVEPHVKPDINMNTIDETNQLVNRGKPCIMGGFKSAKGTNIKVSEESLRKARLLLSETEGDNPTTKNNVFESNNCGSSSIPSLHSMTDLEVVRESEECAKALLSDDHWRKSKIDSSVLAFDTGSKISKNETKCDRNLEKNSIDGMRKRLIPISTSPTFTFADRVPSKPALKPVRCTPIGGQYHRQNNSTLKRFKSSFNIKRNGSMHCLYPSKISRHLNCWTERENANAVSYPKSSPRNGRNTHILMENNQDPFSQTGYWLRMKINTSSKRYSLKSLISYGQLQNFTRDQLEAYGLTENVLSVTSKTAMSFKFKPRESNCQESSCERFNIKTEDDIYLLTNNSFLDLHDFTRAFLRAPSINPSLISEEWVANHFKWIVWKLAAYEVFFPQCFASRSLTPEVVLHQLKYRYDTEINNCKRSALKKIYERDDTACRTLVLCVSDIISKPEKSSDTIDESAPTFAVIELTDGWYSIKGLLDRPLTKLLTDGKISIGQKLCIFGAELIGSTNAVSPLDAPDTLMLRLSANSTRRAKWYSKLGYQRHSRAFPIPIDTIYADGGLVGRLDVVVARSYPLTYMEKTDDCVRVYSERAEDRAARARIEKSEKFAESLYLEAFKELELSINRDQNKKRARQSFENIETIEDGKKLFELYWVAADPANFEKQLNEKQRQNMMNYRLSQNRFEVEKIQTVIQGKIQDNVKKFSSSAVTPIKKIRLINYQRKKSRMPDCFLTIWKPSDEILEMLNEGNRLRIYHLTASPNRFQNTSSSAQLSTTRITKFIPITTYRVAIERLYIERQVYQVGNVKSKFTSMPFDEFDCVGIVVYVDFNCESALTRLVDSVYLADKDCNLLCIRFVNGLKHYAVDDLLTVGMAVSICNLQTKPRMSLAVPIATATELTKVSQNLDKDTGSAFEILLNNLPDKQWLLSKTMDMIRSLRIQENNLNFVNEGLALQTKNKPPASAKKKKAHRQVNHPNNSLTSRPKTRALTRLNDKT